MSVPAGERPAHRAPPRGRIRAVALAVVVHAIFFALIVFGVRWQSTPAPPVQAELWDQLPPAKQAARPPPPEPAKTEPPPEPPKPEPPRPEPPKPEPPKPEPPKPAPPKPVPPKPEAKPPPKEDPAIAEKARREKLEREKAAERERVEKAEKAKREKLEKQKEDEARKKRELDDAKKKREEDRKREEEARVAAEKLREAERAKQAAAAQRKTEFDKYVDAIRAKIRGRANVPDTVLGQPEVHVRIRLLPGGEVLDIAITRRSGNASYDAAIERAIRSASPLPVPEVNSELFPQFRELNLQFRHER